MGRSQSMATSQAHHSMTSNASGPKNTMAWSTRWSFRSLGKTGRIALTRFMTIRPLMASSTHVSKAETQRKPQPRRVLGVWGILADMRRNIRGDFVFVFPPDVVLSYPVLGGFLW